MSAVVNLRRARKNAARDKARRAGDENAARFGQSRAAKAATEAEAALLARRLDGHACEPDSRDGGDD